MLQNGQLSVEILHTMHLAISMCNELLLAIFQSHFNNSQWVINTLSSFVRIASDGSFHLLSRPTQVQNVDREFHALFREARVLLLELLVSFRKSSKRLCEFETLSDRVLASECQISRTGECAIRVEP